MKNYIKNNKLFLIIVIFTILKLVLSSFLPSILYNNLLLDDKLMMNLSTSMYIGDWLGNYNEYILIKGSFFPFILLICKFLNISYSFFFSIIYILSCAYFSYSLSYLIKNKKVLYVIYILLLFNPLSVSFSLFQRLYRNNLIFSQILFSLGSLIALYKNIDSKKIYIPIYYAVMTGLFLSSIILTREDYIWIYPMLLGFTFLIFLLKKEKLIKKILFSLLVIIMIFIPILYVSYNNYKHYGLFITNELTSSYFKNVYLDIESIDTGEEIFRVSITKNQLKLAMENSETLNKMMSPSFEKLYKLNSNREGNITNNNSIWFLRRNLYIDVNVKTAKDMNNYLSLIHEELEIAFQNNKLKKKEVTSSIFLPYPSWSIVKNVPYSLLKTIWYTSSYKDVISASEKDIRNNMIEDVTFNRKEKKYISLDMYIPNYENEKVFNKTSYNGVAGIFNIIALIYKVLNPFVTLLGFVSFIYILFNYKKFNKYKDLIKILIVIFITYYSILCGIAYTEESSFVSIRYFYLGAVYNLRLIFDCLSIYVILSYKRLLKH